jgi:glucosamine--fructose-6-phosphate aminotransferase (isomerizing)
VPEAARAAASVIPGQLLGFYTGIKKGLNPDEPPNLSRVVMLEAKS